MIVFFRRFTLPFFDVGTIHFIRASSADHLPALVGNPLFQFAVVERLVAQLGQIIFKFQKMTVDNIIGFSLTGSGLLDMLKAKRYIEEAGDVRMVGPN